MEEKYYLQDPCMVNPENIQQRHAFYVTYEEETFNNGILKDSVENFDMAHELVFISKNNNGFEVVALAAPLNHTAIYNKIIKYPNHMANFVEHFKNSIKPLVDKVESQRVDLAKLKGETYHSQHGLIIDNPFEHKSAKELQEHFKTQVKHAI